MEALAQAAEGLAQLIRTGLLGNLQQGVVAGQRQEGPV
jgi:hypothetical protein